MRGVLILTNSSRSYVSEPAPGVVVSACTSECSALIRDKAPTSIAVGKRVQRSAHVRGNGGEERGRGWRGGGEE